MLKINPSEFLSFFCDVLNVIRDEEYDWVVSDVTIKEQEHSFYYSYIFKVTEISENKNIKPIEYMSWKIEWEQAKSLPQLNHAQVVEQEIDWEQIYMLFEPKMWDSSIFYIIADFIGQYNEFEYKSLDLVEYDKLYEKVLSVFDSYNNILARYGITEEHTKRIIN